MTATACFWTFYAIAQSRFVNTYTYTYREMGINIGASDISQDKYGKLWFKDYHQIGNYDGKVFTNLGNPIVNANDVGIGIYDLEADIEGNMWVSAVDGLHKYIENQGFQKQPIRHPISNAEIEEITKIVADTSGNFVCGTAYGMLLSYNLNSKNVKILSDSLEIGMIREIFIDNFERIWISTHQGIYTYSNGLLRLRYDFKSDATKPSYFDGHFYRISHDKESKIIANDHQNGLLLFDIKNESLIGTVNLDSSPLHHFTDFHHIKAEHWIVSSDVGMFYFNAQTLELSPMNSKIEKDNWFLSQEITKIYFTQNSVMWFGASTGLAKWQYLNELFVNIELPTSDQILYIEEIPKWDDRWLIITQNNGSYIFTVNGQNIQKIDHKDLQSVLFATTNRDTSELWIHDGEYLKALKINDNTSISGALFQIKLPVKKINDMEFVDPNICLIVIDHKLYQLDIDHSTLIPIVFPNDDDINTVTKTKEGKLFAGGKNLFQIDGDSAILIPQKFPTEIIDITNDNSNNIWIGAEKLYHYDVQNATLKYYDYNNGLSKERVNHVVYDGKENIWMSSSQGLQKFNIDDSSNHIYNYQDGLPNNDSRSGLSLVSPSVVAVRGEGYFSFYRPRYKPNIFKNVSFQFKSITLNGKEIISTEDQKPEVFIPHNKTGLSISYTFPCFLEPSLFKIHYRLVGSTNDTLWIPAPTDNTLVFNQLKPDDYRLEIKASSTYFEDQFESTYLDITALAPFYKTWWFNLLIILGIVSIAGLIIYIREQQQKKLELLRISIARDLHDEMGSNLSNIKLMSELETMQNNSSAATFQKIAEKSGKIMDSMSDIIWNINPSNDDLKNVVTRIQQNAIEALEPLGIQLKFDSNVLHDQLSLGIEKRKDYYFLCKEVVNNISKYSNATKVTIKVELSNKRIYTTISDNGVGFDLENVIQGNGLKNMQERASNLKANFRIDTSTGQGTSIHLDFYATK